MKICLVRKMVPTIFDYINNMKVSKSCLPVAKYERGHLQSTDLGFWETGVKLVKNSGITSGKQEGRRGARSFWGTHCVNIERVALLHAMEAHFFLRTHARILKNSLVFMQAQETTQPGAYVRERRMINDGPARKRLNPKESHCSSVREIFDCCKKEERNCLYKYKA